MLPVGSICDADKVITKLISPLTPTVEFTSSKNIALLIHKKQDFAIVQANVLYDAYAAHPQLKVVAALYPKIVTFITKKENNITSIEDIKTKNLHIAYTCMDTYKTAKTILSACDISHNNIQLSFQEAKEKLKMGKLDGFFALCGHPDKDILTLNNELNISFVPLFGKKFDQLNNDYPYFRKSGIPKNLYKNTKEDIKSLGVKALLVTREDVPEDCVYDITQILLKNIDHIKSVNPIYRGFSKKSMLEGLTIPQHKGAIKAFNAQ